MIDANADTRRACRSCVARLMSLETAVGQSLLAAMTPTSRKLFDVETNAKHTTDVFAAAETNSGDDTENTDDNVRQALSVLTDSIPAVRSMMNLVVFFGGNVGVFCRRIFRPLPRRLQLV